MQVGLPSQMLDMLRGIPMDDVIKIDLDINECDPKPGTPRDDAKLLPGKERLQVQGRFALHWVAWLSCCTLGIYE